MTITPDDKKTVALCIWREARGEGTAGMAGVASVIMNRARRYQRTPTQVVLKKWAFSSMTATGDAQLSTFPAANDPQYATCMGLSLQVFLRLLHDTTEGATLYHDSSIKCPWDRSKIVQTVVIGRLTFYREL